MPLIYPCITALFLYPSTHIYHLVLINPPSPLPQQQQPLSPFPELFFTDKMIVNILILVVFYIAEIIQCWIFKSCL